MKRAFRAEELLHCADVLAGRESGRGRPRTAYLRRATSTAYYALFHELVAHGAKRALPRGPRQDRFVVSRWFSHGNLRKAAEWVDQLQNGRSVPAGVQALLTGAGPMPADLALVAAAVSELQQARHDADYDPAYDATKRRTLGHIDQARAAVRAARRLDDSDEPTYDSFLLLALGGPSMVKST